MTDWINAVGGVLLLCIPVSMALAFRYIPDYELEFGRMEFGDFLMVWAIVYIFTLLFAAVGFAGVVGVVMPTGAFR